MVWVVLLAALALGLAWLTRNPDAPILEQAQEWPVVGPLVQKFRQAYRPSAVPSGTPPSAAESAAEVVVVDTPTEEMLTTSFVWVQAGTDLHASPDPLSPVVQTVASISNLPVLEQRGEWYRVSAFISSYDRLQGWAYIEDYEEPTLEALSRPDPVLPLPASSPDPEKVARARRLMGESVDAACGSYGLVTDVDDAAFLDLCTRITRQVEDLYRRRYALEPVSPPAEVILLFSRAESYRRFRDLEQVAVETATAHARPASGYLALFRGDRSIPEIVSTLVHELVHLLNRRALGPALPPWLAEGIADDLADSKIDDAGRIQPGAVGGERIQSESTVTRRGGLAGAIDLQALLERDGLPTLVDLVEMDPDEFYGAQRRKLHYALSSFWVRYLLSDFRTGTRLGFQRFLQETASGEPITSERFLAALGSDRESLESGFRTWIRLQFLMPPNEVRSDLP